jgi:hypothetical protein
MGESDHTSDRRICHWMLRRENLGQKSRLKKSRRPAAELTRLRFTSHHLMACYPRPWFAFRS